MTVSVLVSVDSRKRCLKQRPLTEGDPAKGGRIAWSFSRRDGLAACRQSGSRGFDPLQLHQFTKTEIFRVRRHGRVWEVNLPMPGWARYSDHERTAGRPVLM